MFIVGKVKYKLEDPCKDVYCKIISLHVSLKPYEGDMGGGVGGNELLALLFAFISLVTCSI